MITKKHLMFYLDEECTKPVENFMFAHLQPQTEDTQVLFVRNESYGNIENITIRLDPSLKEGVLTELLSPPKIQRMEYHEVIKVVVKATVLAEAKAGRYKPRIQFKFWLTQG